MWTRISPNQITWAALFVGGGAAACFAQGDWIWLLAGAVLFHISFTLDCMDGKLARLTGRGSIFGSWLDYVFDRIRVLTCAIALMGGQYERTGEVYYIWLALVVVFLDMLRYVDALQTFKVRQSMREEIKARAEASGGRATQHTGRQLAFMEDLLRENPDADRETTGEAADALRRSSPAAPAGGTPAAPAEGGQGTAGIPGQRTDSPQVVDLSQGFKSRFPWYVRFRNALVRRRIRTHLVSGIEFQMAVFIIGPAVNAIAPVTITAAALLFLFELMIIYKLLLSTRDFTRTMAAFGPVDEAPAPTEPSSSAVAGPSGRTAG